MSDPAAAPTPPSAPAPAPAPVPAPAPAPPAPGATAAPSPDPGSGEWERLHPLTPVLKGGRWLAVGFAFAAQEALRDPDIGVAYALTGLAMLVPFAALGVYLSWRATRFRIGDGVVEHETGVLARQKRRLPLARLESVDLARPLVARLAGLTELRLEAISNTDSEIALAYLPEARALAVRARLLAQRAGVAPDTPAPPERSLVTVPLGPLVATALLGPLALLLGGVVLAITTAAVDPEAGLGVGFGVLGPLLYVAGTQLLRIEQTYGTTVAEAPDGLRTRAGLLNLRMQTVPRGRVQAVRIEEPLLWRPWGWCRVLVEVAGYRGTTEERGGPRTAVLLPVAPRPLAAHVVGRVLPGVDVTAVRLSPAPPNARWRAPLGASRLGAAWTQTHAVTTYGRFRRRTDVVPHGKVQSLRMTQGPWQRRLGLATLYLDTPGRAVTAAARHRDVRDARRLMESSRELDPTRAGRGNAPRGPGVVRA